NAKPKVLLVGHLPGDGNQQLAAAFDLDQAEDFNSFSAGIKANAAAYRGVVVGVVGSWHIPTVVVDDRFFDMFPSVEIVAAIGVGYDHIDGNAAARRGVIVTHTPNVN